MVGGAESSAPDQVRSAPSGLPSPGTAARILLFLISLAGGWVLLFVGFPPRAPDRLPVLLVSLGLALLSVQRPERGILLFSFLFPCVGLLVRLSGGTDPVTWPALLLSGVAAGWCFRFIYDFDSLPDSSRLDRPLRAVLWIWILSTLVAVAHASTLWAAWHGLTGRAVNGEGLLDSEAIRESAFAFSSLLSGAVYFFLLRRSGEAVRGKALGAALLGVCASALAACFQRLGLLPSEARAYWKLTGRLSGAAVDPNSLGVLSGLVLVLALTGSALARTARGRNWLLVPLLVVGLILSGSRTGLLLVILSVPLLLRGRGLSWRLRLAGLAVLLLLLGLFAILAVGAWPGTLPERIAQSFNPNVPMEYRVSARPLLWRAAWHLFQRHPLEGAGLSAFSWQFPDLMREEGRAFPMRDNPGSAYLQALAETGLLGLLMTAAFVTSLAGQALAGVRLLDRNVLRGSAGAAVLAFLVALAVGSHWLAPDVCLLFFLCASVTAASWKAPEKRWIRNARLGGVLLYGAAALAAVLSTGHPEEAFRFSPQIGFHEREIGPGGPFRWTRRRFALWLKPGETRRLRLAHFTPEPRPVELDVTVDRRTVYRRSLEPGESVGLAVHASGSRPRAFLFRVSRGFVPRSLGLSEDRRELGLLSVVPE